MYAYGNTEARLRCLEKQEVLHIPSLCVFFPYLSSMQSACAVLYCHLWPVRFHRNFTHCFINDTIFGGGEGVEIVENKVCALVFSTTFIGNILYFENNSARCYRKCKYVFM